MCSAFGSRTDPSSRSALGQVASSFAEVWESPLANSVTSFPNATSSSVNQCTTRSVPPYNLGGTASVSGATCAMRIYPSPVVIMNGKAPLLQAIPQAAQGTFRCLRSSTTCALLPCQGLADAVLSEQTFAVVADAE